MERKERNWKEKGKEIGKKERNWKEREKGTRGVKREMKEVQRSRRNEDWSENSSGRVSNKLPVIYCYLVAAKLAFCQIFYVK